MKSEYFTLHQSIVDRDDLTIYEKMCCVVLARYAGRDEFEDRLSKDIIAIKMGCSNQEAYKAIEGLIAKGILEHEHTEFELNELAETESKVIKNQGRQSFEALKFEELTGKKSSPAPVIENPVTEAKMKELQDLIEEVVSENALRILLNIANGDVELIKRKYQIARSSQLNDVVEVLMHELQRKTPEIKSVPIEIDQESQDVVNQINKRRIADLYKKNKK